MRCSVLAGEREREREREWRGILLGLMAAKRPTSVSDQRVHRQPVKHTHTHTHTHAHTGTQRDGWDDCPI